MITFELSVIYEVRFSFLSKYTIFQFICSAQRLKYVNCKFYFVCGSNVFYWIVYNPLIKKLIFRKSSGGILHDTDTEEMSSYDQPTIIRLVLAIWYIIMSRSEILCYFIIFLNQIKNATFLSLPLPLMVFFWGALTIPRPSKTFWITIIAYTEVIVLLKCISQFDIMPGNMMRQKPEFTYSSQEHNTITPAFLFGLYHHENYADWDLALLLVVFFHR